MYLRHLLLNVCSIRVVVLVTLHVSEPYSSTLFTLVLKILILFRVEKDHVFHTVFKMLHACLAFPFLFLTSSSVPPLSVTTLPRQVNVLSSSVSFPFSCTLACCVLVVYCSPLVVLFSCTFIFRPVFSAFLVNLLDLFCIYLCVCDSRQMSSAKSRSSNLLANVHWMSCWPCLAVSLVIQYIAMIKINGDRMHSSLTPVFTSNISDTFFHYG